jgi:hypothetical protein
MMSFRLKVVFWKTFVLFLLLLAFMLLIMFSQGFNDSFRKYFAPVFFSLSGLLFLLGVVLLWQIKKENPAGKIRKFLFLTGLCAVGFLASVILHNLFYALAEVAVDVTALNYLLQGIEAAFFVIAIFVCPIGLLVGIIGTLLLLFKK